MALFIPAILLMTVVVSVSFGVAVAYALVLGILSIFGRPAESARPRLVLVPTQNHASGD